MATPSTLSPGEQRTWAFAACLCRPVLAGRRWPPLARCGEFVARPRFFACVLCFCLCSVCRHFQEPLPSSFMQPVAARVSATPAAAPAAAAAAHPPTPFSAGNSFFDALFKARVQPRAATPPAPLQSNVDMGGVVGVGVLASAAPAADDRLALLAAAKACHCLVFDAAAFATGSDDAKQLAALVASSGHARKDLLASVLLWRPWLGQAGSLACAFVEPSERRLHLQFRTHSALAAALAHGKELVRCGSIPPSAWHKVAPCGLPRHELPEKLELSCVTNAPPSAMNDLPAAIKKLLQDDMKLDYTCHWFPGSHSRELPAKVTLHVLPRLVSPADLAATVARLRGLKATLWGHEVEVHAPNTPALARCRDCGELGHGGQTCPTYSGTALRLLFKTPAPFTMLEHLQEMTKARLAFLGHSFGLFQPHRKVTLMFDVDGSDAEAVQVLTRQVGEALQLLMDMLQEAPRLVHPRDRLRECRECGALAQHACPFLSERSKPQGRKPSQAGQRSDRVPSPNKGNQAGPAPAAPAAPLAACRKFRRDGVCPNGDKCKYLHVQQHCFDFANGFCRRGNGCKFPHLDAQQLAAASSAAQAQVHNAAAAPASAAAAAVRPEAAAPPVSSQQEPSAMELDEQKDSQPPVAATSRTPAASSDARPFTAAPAAGRKRKSGSRGRKPRTCVHVEPVRRAGGCERGALGQPADRSRSRSYSLSRSPFGAHVEPVRSVEPVQCQQEASCSRRRRCCRRLTSPPRSASFRGQRWRCQRRLACSSSRLAAAVEFERWTPAVGATLRPVPLPFATLMAVPSPAAGSPAAPAFVSHTPSRAASLRLGTFNVGLGLLHKMPCILSRCASLALDAVALQEIGDPALLSTALFPYTLVYAAGPSHHEAGVGLLLSRTLVQRVYKYFRSPTGRLIGAVLELTKGQRTLLVSAYMPSGLDHQPPSSPQHATAHAL